MSRAVNRNRAKFAVVSSKHESESKLDVLEEFIEWTKEKNIKSYIEIAEMLHTTPQEANRLLNRAVLPDDRVAKRMKEVMRESKCI